MALLLRFNHLADSPLYRQRRFWIKVLPCFFGSLLIIAFILSLIFPEPGFGIWIVRVFLSGVAIVVGLPIAIGLLFFFVFTAMQWTYASCFVIHKLGSEWWNERRPKCRRGHQFHGCICTECGLTRDEGHNWMGCLCRLCFAKRDLEHEWHGCTCRTCLAQRDEGHEWQGNTCSICQAQRDEGISQPS